MTQEQLSDTLDAVEALRDPRLCSWEKHGCQLDELTRRFGAGGRET